MRLTRHYHTLYLLILIGGLSTDTVSPLRAETPFFYDDFERQNLFDTATPWFDDPTKEERLTLRDGRLIIEALTDSPAADPPSATVMVNSLPGGDSSFSLQTQMRYLEPDPIGPQPFAGLLFFNLERDTADWAVVRVNGESVIGSGSGGILAQKHLFAPGDIVENDIHMKLDVSSDRVYFTSWSDDEDQPSEHQLDIDRNVFDMNGVSVFLNSRSDLSGDVSLEFVSLLPLIRGDFSANDRLDAADIDGLSAELRNSSTNRAFDLNDDGEFTELDRTVLVEDLFNTFPGDSNLDREFNSQDLVVVFTAGQYEDRITGNSTWATGDWNGDGDFESGDVVAAFQGGGFERGPRAAATAVPEPASSFILFAGLMGIAFRRRYAGG